MNTKKVQAKSQPSKNARTHGLYASEVVLPEESQKEFDDLLGILSARILSGWDLRK